MQIGAMNKHRNHNRASWRSENRVGIDVGRVLICPVDDEDGPDTSFLDADEETALRIPPAPGSIEVIADLVARLQGRVWLVSKAGPRIQQLTRRWLEHQRFHALTGMPPSHVRFCRRRPEKREHASELGLTHFIDDRLDVLQHLLGLVPSLYLYGVQRTSPPDWVQPVRDWNAVRRALASVT